MAMEAVVLDRTMSACKQIRMMGRRSIPSSENVAPIINIHGAGLLQAPHHPPNSPLFSSFNPSMFNNYRQQQFLQPPQLQPAQPPLLPLPVVPKPQHQSLPSRTRSLSRPPTARKTNNAKSQSLTPKKPKSKLSSSKKEDINNSISECLIIASTTRLGPDPSDLPKNVPKVLSSASSLSSKLVDGGLDIFPMAPPPSSLPLPRFSLKQPKLRCNAEAVEVDAGATDNLCRLLRLR